MSSTQSVGDNSNKLTQRNVSKLHRLAVVAFAARKLFSPFHHILNHRDSHKTTQNSDNQAETFLEETTGHADDTLSPLLQKFSFIHRFSFTLFFCYCYTLGCTSTILNFFSRECGLVYTPRANHSSHLIIPEVLCNLSL